MDPEFRLFGLRGFIRASDAPGRWGGSRLSPEHL